jgi:hypothetical protein
MVMKCVPSLITMCLPSRITLKPEAGFFERLDRPEMTQRWELSASLNGEFT